jgi:hypothetical protein
MTAVDALAREVGIAPACGALGFPRATCYRRHQPKTMPSPRPRPHRALSDDERRSALSQLNSQRFVDVAPGEVHAILLDEGIYHGSVRSLYRLLADEDAVRERRNQLRHPVYTLMWVRHIRLCASTGFHCRRINRLPTSVCHGLLEFPVTSRILLRGWHYTHAPTRRDTRGRQLWWICW